MFSAGSNGLHDAELFGGRRHQLHQAHRALGRHRHRVERGFGLDHRTHQVGVDAVALGVLVDVGVEALGTPVGGSGDADAVVGLGDREGLDLAAVGTGLVGQDHLAGRVAPGVDLRRDRRHGRAGNEQEGEDEADGHADTCWGESGGDAHRLPQHVVGARRRSL